MRVPALLFCLLCLGLPLPGAIAVNSGVAVNGNTSDQVAWSDAAGRTRTASIVQLNGAAQPGKVGGYITQVVYHDGAGNVTCNESGYSVDGLLSGLGQMVNHGGTGNGWVCSNQDGLKAGASTQVLFQGANHVIYQVDMDSYGDNGDTSKGTWHNRWQYFFVTGQDHIVESISYDFSSKPAGYWGYTGLYSQQGHDSRSPYCSFNWTGTGAANTLTESIDGIEWAARDSGTNSYLFKTVGSSPFSGGYTYNTPASNIPYTLQWKNTPDREIGYISTFDLTQFAAGGGFTSESKIGLTSPTMPADWGANYQSNAFQGWRGNKMTWGVPYGSAGGALGVSTFNDWTYARTWTGYPTMGYTILIQMGKHSDDKVRQQVAQQAAIKALPAGAYSAAVGTVPTLGKMNLQSPTADFTLKPRGYNHLYHAWEATCAAGAADVTLALGAASLRNPTFIFNGFTAASLCGLTLNGVPQVEGSDIFSSVDTAGDKLYVTFNKAFTGNQRIVVAASCGTATPTRTPSPVFSPTVTPTQANTPVGGGRQYCLTVDNSAVPALVNSRKLTLKVDVGQCSSVSVTEDGSPVTATYSAGTGLATFSISGASALSTVLVTANGWTSGGTGAATKATLYGDKGWAHSFTFDDGIRDQYTNAKPVFDAKGWRGGLSIIGSGIAGGNPWNMTWAQVQDLRAAGWDIYNHSYTHPNLTCANFASEMDLNQALFAAQFPGYKVSHVVYPYENTAASLCAAWPQPYLLSGEGGGGSYNFVDAPIPAIFRAQRGTFYGVNAASMQALPAAAAAHARPTWLILITHSVAAGSAAAADAYSTNADTLAAYLNWLDSNYGEAGDKSLWFAPSGEVQDYLFTRDNAVVSSSVCGTPTPTLTPCAACTATATRTPSASATPSPTATTAPACSGGLVDDLTDGDTQNAFGNYWYTYAAAGSSINGAAAIVVAPGFGGAGYCARGVGTGPSSTASLGTALAATGSNVSSYSGLSFRFKGDGGTYRVQIHSLVQGAEYNDYKYDFSPPVGWSLVTVPWASFSFPGWGSAYALDTVQLSGLSWVPMGSGAFDFSVDDVQFTCPSAPTATATPTLPAGTATATRTASASATPSPTASSTATPSATRSSTATSTPSPSASATRTVTATFTTTSTSTPSSSASPTRTPSPSATVTRTVSDSPTISPTYTDVPVGSTLTDTPTPSPSDTATETASPSETPTITASVTATPTPSPADTASVTATPTQSPANTASVTGTPTSSPASTASVSATPSSSPAHTHSATPTLTFSPAYTASATATPTSSPANTASFTATATNVVVPPSATPTPTASPTLSASSTPSGTPSGPVGTATATPASTAVDLGTLEILDLQALPNPNPGTLALKLSGAADEVQIDIYSVAHVKVAASVSGPQPAGWSRLSLPAAWAQGLPNGLYHLRIVAKQGQRKSPAVKPLKMMLMK